MPARNVRRVYGVDFSGAVKAGRTIWIAYGEIDGARLQIRAVKSAEALFGVGSGRERCLSALVGFISGKESCAFGLDFPFGLPKELIDKLFKGGISTWNDFALKFGRRFANPDQFRAMCFRAADCHELKRETDKKAKAPFSPYNLRVYIQTYFGIADFLAPIVRSQSACVLPMQEPDLVKPWVVEICPASTLKAHMLPVSGYKGGSPGHRQMRASILDKLLEIVDLRLSGDETRRAIVEDSGGDALDSVVATFATYGALREIRSGQSEPTAGIEGHIYV